MASDFNTTYESEVRARGGLASERHKVLRNTYALLSMTLFFSAATAGIGLMLGIGQWVGLVCSIASLGIIWFVMPKVANKASGIYWTFGFTGLLGFGLAPTLAFYLSNVNGGMIVTQALAGTAITFLALSAYVTTTKKDFSFLQGFVTMGMIVMLVGMLVLLALSLFGVQMPMVSLAFSAGIVLLMSAFILYETSNIIQGHETNYIMATVGLYLSIYNLFTSLLHLIGAFSGDD